VEEMEVDFGAHEMVGFGSFYILRAESNKEKGTMQGKERPVSELKEQ
jgi:hypothetical protein